MCEEADLAEKFHMSADTWSDVRHEQTAPYDNEPRSPVKSPPSRWSTMPDPEGFVAAPLLRGPVVPFGADATMLYAQQGTDVSIPVSSGASAP